MMTGRGSMVKRAKRTMMAAMRRMAARIRRAGIRRAGIRRAGTRKVTTRRRRVATNPSHP